VWGADQPVVAEPLELLTRLRLHQPRLLHINVGNALQKACTSDCMCESTTAVWYVPPPFTLPFHDDIHYNYYFFWYLLCQMLRIDDLYGLLISTHTLLTSAKIVVRVLKADKSL